MNEYEEVETEDYVEDLSAGDCIFIGGGLLVTCFVFAFLMKTLKKNFKNMHVKIGDKIDIGIETKEGE